MHSIDIRKYSYAAMHLVPKSTRNLTPINYTTVYDIRLYIHGERRLQYDCTGLKSTSCFYIQCMFVIKSALWEFCN